MTSSSSVSFRWGVIVIGAIVAFALVRLAGMFGDLWLDEIWSVRMVEQIKSPWEILTVLRHDNNHPLNSLWLYLLGPGAADWSYRLLSWLAGSASVGLAGAIAWRQTLNLSPGETATAKLTAALAMVLTGGSYLLIHYSSEARGYAPMLACALFAVWALQHADEEKWGRWAVGYAVAATLGLLAHVAMAEVLLAGMVWSAGGVIRSGADWKRPTIRSIIWHAVLGAMAAVYYFGFVAKLEIGGGPQNPLFKTLGETAAYTLGLPVSAGTFAFVLFVLLCAMGIFALWRGRDWRTAVFYGVVLFAAPALAMAASKFTLLFPRYFLLNAALALPLIAHGLAWIWRCGRGGRMIVLIALAGFLAGNALPVSRLARDGRGQYSAALREIASHAQAREISLSSDHDFRNHLLIDYYRAAAGEGHEFVYYSVEQAPPWGVQWVLFHRFAGDEPPPAVIADARGNQYVREYHYSHTALSGWDWYVYRNESLILER